MSTKGAQPKRQKEARRASRLAAVQAIYQMELTGADAETVADEFVAHRFSASENEKPDEALFADIVRGVPHWQAQIDRAIRECLASGWRMSRVDSIVRAILRAAGFELLGRKDIPAKVILDEYVDISHAFFAGEEPSFVNAALDKIARHERPQEFGLKPRDDAASF